MTVKAHVEVQHKELTAKEAQVFGFVSFLIPVRASRIYGDEAAITISDDIVAEVAKELKSHVFLAILEDKNQATDATLDE